jgi:hypothetical protein
LRIRNKVVRLPMLLSGGFWTEWIHAEYQQISFALTGRWQGTKLDSSANCSEHKCSVYSIVIKLLRGTVF